MSSLVCPTHRACTTPNVILVLPPFALLSFCPRATRRPPVRRLLFRRQYHPEAQHFHCLRSALPTGRWQGVPQLHRARHDARSDSRGLGLKRTCRQSVSVLSVSFSAFPNAWSFPATLFTTTSMLTFEVANTNTYFCSTLRPESPLPALNSSGKTYCPFGPGPFALSTSVTLGKSYALATFDTRLRALDPFQNELLCIDLDTTPLEPNSLDPIYGDAQIVFWCTVALAIAYWLLVGLARMASAWGRGSIKTGKGFWARVESAGFILASAISGERLATSPALMRFCTSFTRNPRFHGCFS